MTTIDKKTEILKETLAAFTKGCDECAQMNTDFGLRNGWVICFADDYLPIRENEGTIGAMVGGKVWVGNSAHYADEVARDLRAKAKPDSNVTLVVLPISVWAIERAKVLTNLIAVTQRMAADNGITL